MRDPDKTTYDNGEQVELTAIPDFGWNFSHWGDGYSGCDNPINITMTDSIGTNIQRVIDEVTGKEYEQVVNFIILKSFMQAYYGIKPLGHFGLGFKDYTHFTSPIRRYPDLVVHRCIESLIDKAPHPYTIEELRIIGEKSSEMERLAQNAERDLIKMTSCRLMNDQVGEAFDAIISGST